LAVPRPAEDDEFEPDFLECEPFAPRFAFCDVDEEDEPLPLTLGFALPEGVLLWLVVVGVEVAVDVVPGEVVVGVVEVEVPVGVVEVDEHDSEMLATEVLTGSGIDESGVPGGTFTV
jgi:hypothetical protein